MKGREVVESRERKSLLECVMPMEAGQPRVRNKEGEITGGRERIQKGKERG